MTEGRADIVVVGNGAVGTTTAVALARRAPDLRVALVGPSDRPGGASVASGALLGCFGEITALSLASEAGRERFELQLAAHRRWPGHLEDLAAHSESRALTVSDDTYVILNARGGAPDSANYAAMLAAIRDRSAAYDEVEAVPGLRPNPDARPLRTLHLPGEGAVDARAVMAALAAQAAHAGVDSVDITARGVLVSDGLAQGVALADGHSVMAGHVVIATGAETTPLLESLGSGPPVQPVFSGSGVALATERVTGPGFTSAVRTVNRAGSCGLHLIPLAGGREYIGATNVIFRTPELRPHLGVIQFLTGCAIDQLDTLLSYSRIDEVRIGNRPVALDTYPLLGPGPVGRLTILTGTGRDGFHAAPEIARLAAGAIVDGEDLFPARFAPTRAPIFTLSVSESIDEFVAQQVASAFEAGIRTTPFLAGDDLGDLFRPLAERLYKDLGLDRGLHPDIVNYLCLTRKSDDDVKMVATYLQSVQGTS